jgi:hypothetical protein
MFANIASKKLVMQPTEGRQAAIKRRREALQKAKSSSETDPSV